MEDTNRLQRLGCAQDGAPCARVWRRPGVGARIRAPDAGWIAAEQTDRRASLGRWPERTTDPRTRQSLQRGVGRRAQGGWPESGEGSVGYPAAAALPADPLRT